MDASISQFELTESMIKHDSSKSNSENDDNDIIIVDNEEKKSSDEEDIKLPKTVTELEDPETGAKVYLVGTAHFSEESKNDVAQTIRIVQPHIVILELCDARTQILSFDEKRILDEAKKINLDTIRATIKSNGVYYGMTYLLLLHYSAHITKEIGMAPGGEFRTAIKEATKIPNCMVRLGDRPIRITMLRAFAQLSWFQTLKMAWQLVFNSEKITKEDIEKCKEKDMLEQLLSQLTDEYPAVGKVFIDERDIFLTYSLQTACKIDVNTLPSSYGRHSVEPLRIVGVVGIGHTVGIQKLFNTDQKPFIKDIMIIPPETMTSKVLKLTFKLSLYSFLGFLAYKYIPVPKTVKSSCSNAFQVIVEKFKYI